MQKNTRTETLLADNRLRSSSVVEWFIGCASLPSPHQDFLINSQAASSIEWANQGVMPSERQSLNAVSLPAALRSSSLQRTTPGMRSTRLIPVVFRSPLADFFARRPVQPFGNGVRYDTAYLPGAIATMVLRYFPQEASWLWNE